MPAFAAPRRRMVLSPRIWRDLVIEVNDGIIATAGIVEGLVAADVRNRTILISAAIALVVGSASSAGARYTEAAFHRDAALAAVAQEREQIERDPEAELEELVQIYVAKGLSPGLARQVATELMEHDALAAHVEEDLDVDDEDFLPAGRLSVAVGLAYAAGAALPILISLLVPAQTRVLTTLVAVTISLVITSYVGARIGHTHPARTVLRAVVVGVGTLLLALLVGQAFG
jgi:VIT1/CCC1 family predicted Fe2+/Mn2+ transporter